jgi:ElaB/YqjD/DUF883 family membrane-anchored ribosome-binding protein
MESTCDELTAKEKVQLLAKSVDRAKAAVSDTIEDGKMAAERLLKRGRYAVEDTVEQRVHDIRRKPVKAVAVAFGSGMVVGFLIFCLRRRPQAGR